MIDKEDAKLVERLKRSKADRRFAGVIGGFLFILAGFFAFEFHKAFQFLWCSDYLSRETITFFQCVMAFIFMAGALMVAISGIAKFVIGDPKAKLILKLMDRIEKLEKTVSDQDEKPAP